MRFASPLSDGGRAFYNYFLVDSMVTEGRKVYKIRFHPKRLTTPVLDGGGSTSTRRPTPSSRLGAHAQGQ